MPFTPKDNLKKYFESGDQPTAGQFATLIDSMVNILDDRYLLGLRVYDPLKFYLVDDTTIFGSILYKCIADTTGAFNPLNWSPITALGSVVYISTWDAIANNPPLQSSVGVQGNYYVVQNASSNPSDNTMLDGINDWGISDWVIFNGSVWQKVDNSTAPVEAKNVIFEPVPGISATEVQSAIKQCTDLIAKKQDLITLKPNYIPFANSIHTFAESCISNESNGISIDHGKVFRSVISGFGQIDFGQDDKSVRLSTDGGALTKSFLQLTSTQITLRQPSFGFLVIGSGSDNNGDIQLRTGLNNGLSANSASVLLVNTQGNGASLDLQSTGNAELAADKFIADAVINVPQLNADTVPYIDSSNNLISSTTTSAELGYLSGVTSSIQGQLDGKQAALGFTPVANTTTVNGHALNADVTVLASEVPQDPSNRFVTNAQIASWDAKQNAITTGSTAQYFRGDLSLATLNSAAVGLGNVPNVDATNPANITQDPTHRFVLDTEKATWNAKQNAITLGTTAQYFRGDLSLGTFNSSAIGLGNVTNDRQLSQKVSADSGTTLYSSTSSVFSPIVAGNTITVPAGIPDSNYMLEWYYELGVTNAGAVVGSRVTFNGTIISMHAQQPGVATNDPPASPNDYFTSACGFFRTGILTAGTSYPFIFELNKISGNGTAYMRRVRYTLTKI